MQLRMFKRGRWFSPKPADFPGHIKSVIKQVLWCLESDEYHFCPADALCFMVWFMAESLQGWAGDPPPWSPVSLQTHKHTIRGDVSPAQAAQPRPECLVTGERGRGMRSRLAGRQSLSWTTSKLKVVMSGNFLPEPGLARSVSSVLNAKDISI